MAIRRRFASVPPVFVSAKTSRSRSYEAMPSRAARHLMAYPASRADKVAYDSRAEDYLNNRVSNASYFSNYALDEGYDTARQSRNRDARLLRDATDAIVHSESFATPQTSVAARRVARGQSMAPLRATSVPPRPLYPLEVDYWDVPGSYAPLYRLDTQDTTTTDDLYPYYYRRPMVVYPKPWMHEPRGRGMMRRSPERARSVPPPLLMFREEQRRKLRAVPVYDDWRGVARAKSVPPPEALPVSRSWYLPYFERRMSPYYKRRLALSLPPPGVPHLSMPTEGLRAHRMPRRYLARDVMRTGFPSLWGYHGYEPGARRREEEEEAVRFGARPRVLASPLARATLARAWRHATTPSAPPKATMAYYQESKSGFPLLYVQRKGPKRVGRQKAAIIASKMDVESFRGRRPRSDYAARKYRSIRLADQENIYAKSPQTAGYYASHPPLSAPASGSRTLSKVVVRRPGSVMEQVVTIPYETAKKRSRFLKRASSAPPVKYFPSPYDFPDPRLNVPKRGTISPLPKQSTDDGADGERQRATVKIPNYYAYGVDPANPPVSDLRKRIRKTLNKTRRSR